MKTPECNTKRVLVVEDEPSVSAVCHRVLTREGFEVDIALDGRSAQDMIEDKQYDLLLFDIKVPTMNGKELYQWLQDKYPQLTDRVIFTSGDIMVGDTPTFLERVARPFIPKPFTPDELKNIIIKTAEEIIK